ncbi:MULTISPECIES: Crp/Fnr family transcriptional regulator [Mesoflavibacter]|uniref:Crp/Fnr family transcriptional regulator n=1 Tax=Mesoflavibacter profundi TaxID=2708110 RepID=A0ABT4RXP7_9FLAO|nr:MULTISPECIES: Crp/Fnr family transcriptional regulator [Mesoflavibacter]MDA0176331.1 Crp/Fnr family transcriptional regulator [Mesoflavibacter profundi]QIJ89971.1 Transcriptional regulator, Crp/Fnr family [Mesoflavibacter sp. HG96]QIJ92699.1 Transcriptional regulator, Crp/Fnr family [Mesoflavibacter sp. HG37]
MSKCEQCIVRQFNSLKALTKEELMRVSACKTTQIVKKGDVLFEEGDVLNGIYCIRDGVCKMTKLSENGKDQVVKLAFKGGMVGQRSLVSGEPTNLTAVAVNDMQICFVPKTEILQDLQKNPNFSLDVLKTMAADLKNADDQLVDMAQKNVKQRLADTLLYVEEKFGTDKDGFLFLTLSREDYASIVGTATESAIRILSQFKKLGLISTKGKQIKLEDKLGLQRME